MFRNPSCPVNERKEKFSAFLTEQLAESIVSLLGLGFPSSSESHSGDVGGWRREGRDAEAS